MRATLLATLAFFTLFQSVHGQTPSAQESLLIGPGDQLHIQAFDTPEFEQHVRVTDAGNVPLQLIGNIHVAGLTPAQASELIDAKLISGHFILDPQATVIVDQFATQTVSVLGEVKTPGTFTITAPRTVLDMVAMAGGLTAAADRHIGIKHAGKEKASVQYYLSNDASTALENSVLVYPGDTVLVPKAGIVYVLGDVRLPGGYVMNNNSSELSVVQMVATAGGANNSAVLSHARLVRRQPDGTYTTTTLDLGKLQKGKQPDIPLQPSDIVYVPFSFVKNAAVASTGGLISSTSSALIYTH